MREEAAKGLSFEQFLESLNLVVDRVELDEAKLDRIAQLHVKTNQFNLTSIRYTRQDIDKLLQAGFRISMLITSRTASAIMVLLL